MTPLPNSAHPLELELDDGRQLTTWFAGGEWEVTVDGGPGALVVGRGRTLGRALADVGLAPGELLNQLLERAIVMVMEASR